MRLRRHRFVIYSLTIGSVAIVASQAVVLAQGAANYPQYQAGASAAAQAPRMRDLFAASLASVLTGVAGTAVTTIAQGLTGSLNNWFQQKALRRVSAPQMIRPNVGPMGTYPGNANGSAADGGNPSPYPDPSNADDPGTTGSYPGTTGSYPGTNGADGYPGSNGGGDVSAPPGAYYPPAPGQGDVSGNMPVYAGVAYEVQALRPGGQSVRVDPNNYVFVTGDQFRVDYRPSLPGQVDVFNTNALGRTTQIDSVTVGGGALVSLGPYEFAATTGSENLTIRLSPCTSSALMTQTRDIAKASGNSPGATSTVRLPLDQCGSATMTRRLKAKPKTRDIRKVSVEDGTSFALDKLSPGEMSTGQVAPREVTITMQHR